MMLGAWFNLVSHLVTSNSLELLTKIFHKRDHDGYIKLLKSKSLKGFVRNLRRLLLLDYALGDKLLVYVLDKDLMSGYELRVFRLMVRGRGIIFNKRVVSVCPSIHKAREVRDSLLEAKIFFRVSLVNGRDRIMYFINPRLVDEVKK